MTLHKMRLLFLTFFVLLIALPTNRFLSGKEVEV